MLFAIQILLTTILIGGLMYIFVNWQLHCPKCRRIFAAKVASKKKIKDKKVEEMIWNEKKGMDEKKTISIKTMQYQYACKYCGRKWKARRQEY